MEQVNVQELHRQAILQNGATSTRAGDPPAAAREGLAQKALEEIFCVRHVKKGQVLFQQGEEAQEIFYILRGRIGMERSDPYGHASLLCVRTREDFICPLSLFDTEGRYVGTARAWEDSVVLVAPKDRFMEAYRSYPILWQWAHRQCLMQIHHIMDRLNVALHYTVEQRLAWLLWHEAEQWGAVEKDQPMEIHLTQQELASWIGATRETVSRILQKWKRKGWIDVKRGRLIVKQPEALSALLEEGE